jgi:hypothetical protein
MMPDKATARRLEALTNEFVGHAHDLGVGAALVLIDTEQFVQVGLSTENVSEATVCVGVLIASILREGEPECPHCLNNFRRLESALRVMRQHRTRPHEHVHLQ